MLAVLYIVPVDRMFLFLVIVGFAWFVWCCVCGGVSVFRFLCFYLFMSLHVGVVYQFVNVVALNNRYRSLSCLFLLNVLQERLCLKLCYGSDDQDDGEDEWFHIRMKYINVYVE